MDYISRQAAIEAVHNHFNEGGFICYDDGQRMLDKIMDLPAAPVREVVLCKDCKHRDVENGFCEGRGWPMQLVPDDGFCEKGERSEE